MDFAKKNDKLISLGIVILTVSMIYIVTRDFFLTFASNQSYLSSFIKFFFLASMGDFIGFRLKKGVWSIPKNILLKAIMWGLIGIVIYMMFQIFPNGVLLLQDKGLLPFSGSTFFFALFSSTLMNLIFAPTMMIFHRISDTYLDGAKSVSDAIKSVDWSSFFNVVILRTIPLFWIPAHTITFLLPEEYRLILAAVLGIFLGLLLGLFKK